MEIIKQDNKDVDKVVTALENEAVLVLATDTVYGLVCDATSEKATRKILKIKNRDELKTLLIFVDSIDQAEKFALMSEEHKEFLKKNWPGAVTVILNARNIKDAKKRLSVLVYKNGTIGMRNPSYGFLNLVLKKFGRPLAQTSANISGQPSTNKIAEIMGQFGGQTIQPDIVVNAGDLSNSKPSSIIDLTKNKIKILRK